MFKKFFILISPLVILSLLLSACEFREYRDASFSEVKKRGKLIVGTFPGFGAISFKNKDGEIVGHDIELIKKIADDLKIDVEIKETPFLDLFSKVKIKELDVAIASITITSKRSEDFLFSSPYMENGQVVIIYKKNKDEIKSFEDLRGKNIGVMKGTIGEEEAKKYNSASFIFSYDNPEEAYKEGVVEALIGDKSAAIDFVKNHPDLMMIEEPFTKEYYGIITNKENKALMNQINKSLEKLKNSGELKKLLEKWFGSN